MCCNTIENNEQKVNEQAEKKATAEELTLKIKEAIREELVGLTERTGKNSFVFALPNGQKFEILVTEL